MTAAVPSPRRSLRAQKSREAESKQASFCAPVTAELALVASELEKMLPNGSRLIDEVCDHLLDTRGKRLRPL